MPIRATSLGWTVAVALLSTVLAACGAQTRATGAECSRDTQCESGLCGSRTCLDPSGDDDGDGLSNALEVQLTSDPLNADSDGDTRPDGTEAPDGQAIDSDGDGIPDLLESRTRDTDSDCLPDELDASADAAALSDVAALYCVRPGVCATAPATATCTAGVPTCQWTDPSFQAVETHCDGLDNDCDGETDEGSLLDGVAPGGPCTAPGACGAGVVECSPDGPICSTAPGGSTAADTPELCNGLDDDCNGDTDDGVTLAGGLPIGAPCDGTGLCGPGVVECADGGPVCSTLPGGSAWVEAVELCNGLDDDCDGETDEDFAVGELPIGADCGQGVCTGGTVVCAPGGFAAQCSTSVYAEPSELCNGLDDNCDGQTDEEEALDTSLSGCPTQGVCASGNAITVVCDGQWHCVPNDDGPWQQGTETACDGLDNDCDGLTDESFTYPSPDGLTLGVGQTCGLGECAGGTVSCSSDQKGAICTTAADSQLEQCDGLDNDCDGATDEGLSLSGLPLGALCDGVGACGTGVVTCHVSSGETVCSTDPGGPADESGPELCNQLDDDCDGSTDELDEVLAAEADCSGPGICADGGGTASGCLDGVLQCTFTSVEGWEGPEETTCDGYDNDCDGYVDEGLPRTPAEHWTPLDDGTPPPRANPAFVRLNDDRFLLAGGDRPSVGPHAALSDTWLQDASTGRWTRLDTAPPPERAGAALAALDGAAWRIGGRTDAGVPTADVWRFDWCDDCAATWSEVAVQGNGAPRSGHVVVADETADWLWVLGGEGEGGSAAVTALDLDADPPQWVAGLPQGPGWRVDAAAVLLPADGIVGRRLLIHGGRTPTQSGSTALGDTWILDIDAKGWTPFEPTVAPPPRSNHAIVRHGTDVFVYGGTGATGELLDDFWRLDTQTLTWSPLASSGAGALAGSAMETLNGSLLLFGGQDSAGPSDGFWRRIDDVWSPIAPSSPLPPRQTGGHLLVLGPDNTVLLGGENDGTPAGDRAWTFDGEWSAGALIPVRRRASITSDGERLFMHGGIIPAPDGDPAQQTVASSLMIRPKGSTNWNLVALTAPVRAEHASVWLPQSSRLWVIGGVTTVDAPPEAPASPDVRAIDPAAGTATPVTIAGDGPVSVRNSRAYRHGDLVFLAGGTGSTLWAIDTSGPSWVEVATLPGPCLDGASALFEAGSPQLVLPVELGLGQRVMTLVALTAPAEVTTTSLLAPPPGAVAAYDPTAGRAIVFGGQDPDGYAMDRLEALTFGCTAP